MKVPHYYGPVCQCNPVQCPMMMMMMMMMVMMMVMMMTTMMMMGDKVPHFYIYKLPIVRLSGCYWYI